jgi:hypothetical protein
MDPDLAEDIAHEVCTFIFDRDIQRASREAVIKAHEDARKELED